MKTPDVDRERSEKRVTLADFLRAYNQNLPEAFPRASAVLLRKYQETYAGQFKHGDLWSLDQHRKNVMDWLPGYLKSLQA